MECLDRVLDLPGRLPAGPLRKRPDVGGLRSKVAKWKSQLGDWVFLTPNGEVACRLCKKSLCWFNNVLFSERLAVHCHLSLSLFKCSIIEWLSCVPCASGLGKVMVSGSSSWSNMLIQCNMSAMWQSFQEKRFFSNGLNAQLSMSSQMPLTGEPPVPASGRLHRDLGSRKCSFV